MPPKLIIICGPTATGKTRLGVALAKRFHGEVVSADSMQIYRDMQIGTARPTLEEMEGVPHHMMGVVAPGENYSVARYVEEATACVEDILRRGKQPIVVGGTGLYIDALRQGRSFSAFRPESGHRARLQERAARGELPALWEELQRIDPEGAAKLHPNDEKRILRGLEVWYETGKTLSQHNRETQSLPPRYEGLTIALTYQDRQDLYARIDQRVDLMMERGLVEEVRALLAAGIPRDCTAMQAIGYKELVEAVETGGDLKAAAEEIKLRSRQYAKRQLTWFRRDKNAHWIFLEKTPDFSAVVQDSTEFLKEKGLP
ncbi:MAG: tRNA (adenosine(37)-N6)-dimethylallyltransferase MiaA [Evtepia sp.]|uniref:tRNA (adenosine(37)-N6)-dimethylallyltransferase MiaA n=1 Tax=Evtepia sp. TaxID=2773933 RepID=UPI002A755879|nr:tRNA (adenosine(37)-N6)-dimethylallyltransferase MiaA [Evtepia sp.]MDY3015404.1 tRNA (adenosine(37)-N6)-dimethylallyltransferase MiaA [Evtepia sp.]